MSVNASAGVPRTEPLVPEPEFEVTGAAHVPFAAAPTLRFNAVVTEPQGIEIQSIALTSQVMIDPARRGYDPETRERLAELFGPPASWAPSTSGLHWARVGTSVPGFRGQTTFEIEVPCTYDLEVAAAKYFYAVHDGQVPLSFHFNGNIFYRSSVPDGGRVMVVPVSWTSTAQYRMPLQVWRAMIAEHYPGGGWIRVDNRTLEALNRRRGARGLPSFDATVRELLELEP
ncbi:MAG: DUF6084 family protein [Solirubrobacteraceae bacterium]